MSKHQILHPNDEMVPAVSIAATRGHLEARRLGAFPHPVHGTLQPRPIPSVRIARPDTGKNPIGLL